MEKEIPWIALGVLALLSIADYALAALWVAPYFRLGLPIYSFRFTPRRGLIRAPAVTELEGWVHKLFKRQTVLHRLSDDTIAIREALQQWELIRSYRTPVHGYIRCDARRNEVEYRVFLDLSMIGLALLVLILLIGLRPPQAGFWLGAAALFFVATIVYARHRCALIRDQLAVFFDR